MFGGEVEGGEGGEEAGHGFDVSALPGEVEDGGIEDGAIDAGHEGVEFDFAGFDLGFELVIFVVEEPCGTENGGGEEEEEAGEEGIAAGAAGHGILLGAGMEEVGGAAGLGEGGAEGEAIASGHGVGGGGSVFGRGGDAGEIDRFDVDAELGLDGPGEGGSGGKLSGDPQGLNGFIFVGGAVGGDGALDLLDEAVHGGVVGEAGGLEGIFEAGGGGGGVNGVHSGFEEPVDHDLTVLEANDDGGLVAGVEGELMAWFGNPSGGEEVAENEGGHDEAVEFESGLIEDSGDGFDLGVGNGIGADHEFWGESGFGAFAFDGVVEEGVSGVEGHVFLEGPIDEVGEAFAAGLGEGEVADLEAVEGGGGPNGKAIKATGEPGDEVAEDLGVFVGVEGDVGGDVDVFVGADGATFDGDGIDGGGGNVDADAGGGGALVGGLGWRWGGRGGAIHG